jgi:hypothetical protein
MSTRRRERGQGIVAWQWALYRDGHGDRVNLLIHALTAPVFLMGTCALALAPLGHGWLAVAGAGAMAGAIALQGRTHRREPTPPVPFAGPADVVARIFVEQWITFPRYVLSGEFARAWRAAGVPR